MIFTFSSRGMSKGEWDNVIKSVGAEHVEILDRSHQWFLQDHWEDEIRKLVETYGQPKLTLGSSQGGFAALCFQHIIGAQTVLAFNPQATTIPTEMRAMGSDKNIKWAGKIEAAGHTPRQIPGLGRKRKWKPVIYFGCNKNDRDHRNLTIEKGYPVIDVPIDDHNLPGAFHKQGQLVEIIKNLYYNA